MQFKQISLNFLHLQ